MKEKWIKMKLKSMILLGLYVTLLLLIIPIGQAQVRSESILKRAVRIDPMFHANIWSAMHDLADQGIPIGFEAAEDWSVDTGPQLSLKSGSLLEVLNAISEQNQSYTWQEVDGVINVFPAIGRNQKSVSILETRIGPIIVNKGDDRASIVERLRKLFNKARGKDLYFLSAIGTGNHLGLPDRSEEQLRIPSSDMRTALNKLIKKQEYRPIWSIVRYSNQEELTLVF